MIVVNDKVQIPVQLLEYVQENKLVKAFAVFMYLKCMSGGKMRNTQDAFIAMPEVIGIKDTRTINKHLKTLLKLNWIGFNTATDDYFVRGIGYIRKQHGFKQRKAATFHFKDIQKMQAFVAGSIISSNIKAQQYFFEVAQRGRLKSATMNQGVAKQDRSLTSTATIQKPAYYGLGIYSMAKILFCKPTRACELKQEAEAAGFIKAQNKFREIATFEKSDTTIRGKMAYAEDVKRIRFKKIRRNKKNMVAMLEQLHDEIKPKVDFKKIKRFNHL